MSDWMNIAVGFVAADIIKGLIGVAITVAVIIAVAGYVLIPHWWRQWRNRGRA